jgi:hypothetical protein
VLRVLQASDPVLVVSEWLFSGVNALGSELIEINDNQQPYTLLPNEFNWLARLACGQQLA